MAAINLIVTTSRAPALQETQKAGELAQRLGVAFLPRTGRSLAHLNPGGAVLVVTRTRLVLHASQGEFFFHPGMARPRVRRLADGGKDAMVDAMELAVGDRVLDCTLGLGTDAIVASYVVGDTGQVVGLESVPVIAELVADGLRNFAYPDQDLVAAIRRIAVRRADYLQLLPELGVASFDVVYFDPMFREPVHQSSHMTPWRGLADARPVSRDAIQMARRVARRRVVLKERRYSTVFTDLGFSTLVGGGNSRIAYGVLDVCGDDVGGD